MNHAHGRCEQLCGCQDQQAVREVAKPEQAHRTQVAFEAHRQTAQGAEELQCRVGRVLGVLNHPQEGQDRQHARDHAQPQHEPKRPRRILPVPVVRQAQQGHAQQRPCHGAQRVHGPVKTKGTPPCLRVDGLDDDGITQRATQAFAEP